MRHLVFPLLTFVLIACRTTEEARIGAAAETSGRSVALSRDGVDAEAQVRAAVEGIYAALSAEDAAAIAPYIPATGYSEFPVTGVLARYGTETFAGLTGEVDYHFTVEDLMVEPYGDAAVATGYRVHSIRRPNGTVDAGTRRLSMVWALMDGQWKITHVHLSAAPVGAVPPSSEAENRVRGAHAAWFQAVEDEDADALNRLLDDEMTFHGPGGGSGTKAGFVAAIQSGKLYYDSLAVVDQPQIRLYGDTAIVTGAADILYRWEETPCLEWLRYTAVYGWSGSEWRMLAWQSTYRPDSPCNK